MHYGPEQPRIQTKELGLIHSIILLHCSLIRLLNTAHLSLLGPRSAHYFTPSLTHSLSSSRGSERIMQGYEAVRDHSVVVDLVVDLVVNLVVNLVANFREASNERRLEIPVTLRT